MSIEGAVGSWLKNNGFPESIKDDFKKVKIVKIWDFKNKNPSEMAVILESIIKTKPFEDHFDLIIPFKSAITALYIDKRGEWLGMTHQQRAMTMIDTSRRETRQKEQVGKLFIEEDLAGKMVKDGGDLSQYTPEDIVPSIAVPKPSRVQSPKRPKAKLAAPKKPRPRPRQRPKEDTTTEDELKWWAVWKAAYCTYCRLINSSNQPKEYIDIDSNKFLSKWQKFSGRVQVNDPMNLWAVSYHQTQPKIAIYKSYKKICNTIYYKYDPKELMAKSLETHGIHVDYYKDDEKEDKIRKRIPFEERRLPTYGYGYDYYGYGTVRNTGWGTNNNRDWYDYSKTKKRVGLNEYRNRSWNTNRSKQQWNTNRSKQQWNTNRSKQQWNTNRSKQQRYKQWYPYPVIGNKGKESKESKRVRKKSKPELYNVRTWRGHYVWKKNQVKSPVTSDDEWREIETFIPRIKAQRKKSEYAKSEYLLCWERLKYNENTTDGAGDAEKWKKAFNYLFFGLNEKDKVIMDENMICHESRMNMFKLLSQNGVEKTLAIYRKMLYVGDAVKISDLQKKSTTLILQDQKCLPKDEKKDGAKKEPVIGSANK